MKFKYLVLIIFALVGIGKYLIPEKYLWFYVPLVIIVSWWLFFGYEKRKKADQEFDNWLSDD